MNRRVDYVLQTLKSYHIKDFTIHKSLQRVEKLYQMEVEVVVEFSDFSKCEQVCNLLVEKLDETVKVSHPFLYHTPSKLDSLRYGWFGQYIALTYIGKCKTIKSELTLCFSLFQGFRYKWLVVQNGVWRE